jgi:hypothetical protein
MANMKLTLNIEAADAISLFKIIKGIHNCTCYLLSLIIKLESFGFVTMQL